MIPASQTATSGPPKRGSTATTRPATISTTPTASIAWCAVPGTIESICGARYFDQSVSTFANLSRPNRMGRTVKPIRSTTKTWCAATGTRCSGTTWCALPRSVMMTSGLKDGRLHVRTLGLLRQDSCLLETGGTVTEDLAGQIAAVGALTDPARRALYRLVAAASEPVSRDQAAAGVGMARHTVKFHLDRLVDDGLLDTEYRRLSRRRGPGAGRPSKLYRRAARQIDVTLPERHYDLAGQILAGAVEAASVSGEPVLEAVDAAATAEGRRLASPGSGLTDVLTDLGFEPREAADDVVLGNCPFHALATSHTALVCGMNLGMLTALLDERGEPVSASLDPAPGRCCVVLHPS